MHIESIAIVLHHLQSGMHGESLSAVAHDFRQSDSGPSLGPGRVFSTADKIALARVLIDDLDTSVELLSERCLVANLETLMWFRPRANTKLNISGVDYTVPLPSLLFLCHQGKLYVKAYKGTGRPHEETELYSAGLPNLYAQGSWCAGGNQLPSHPSQRDIERIETMFFESPFTHAGTEPLPVGTTDMVSWFESLQGKRTFPTRTLKSSGLTLKRWISHVSGGF